METEKEKISIVIPVYNVEPYIEKCLSSVVNQTYKNIEIIIVIDGSTDKSEEICNSFAKDDDRIIIIKQENQGLSAARNSGIKVMTGEFVMFVDGDDYVDKDFCIAPYVAAKENNADLVIFNYLKIDNTGAIVKTTYNNLSYGIISKNFAIEQGDCVVWNKLYHSSLFHGFLFPEGRVYEDISTTHKLIINAKKIIRIKNDLYFYVNNPNSITNTNTIKNYRDCLLARFILYNDLNDNGYSNNIASHVLFLTALNYLLHVNPSKSDKYYLIATEVLNKEIGLEKCDTKHKLLFFLWKRNKLLFHLICHIFRKRIKD